MNCIMFWSNMYVLNCINCFQQYVCNKLHKLLPELTISNTFFLLNTSIIGIFLATTKKCNAKVAELLSYSSIHSKWTANFVFTAEVLFVVCSKQALDDIAKFCTEPRPRKSSLVVDKRFDVARFT